jgi:hypothetical protein
VSVGLGREDSRWSGSLGGVDKGTKRERELMERELMKEVEGGCNKRRERELMEEVGREEREVRGLWERGKWERAVLHSVLSHRLGHPVMTL